MRNKKTLFSLILCLLSSITIYAMENTSDISVDSSSSEGSSEFIRNMQKKHSQPNLDDNQSTQSDSSSSESPSEMARSLNNTALRFNNTGSGGGSRDSSYLTVKSGLTVESLMQNASSRGELSPEEKVAEFLKGYKGSGSEGSTKTTNPTTSQESMQPSHQDVIPVPTTNDRINNISSRNIAEVVGPTFLKRGATRIMSGGQVRNNVRTNSLYSPSHNQSKDDAHATNVIQSPEASPEVFEFDQVFSSPSEILPDSTSPMHLKQDSEDSCCNIKRPSGELLVFEEEVYPTKTATAKSAAGPNKESVDKDSNHNEKMVSVILKASNDNLEGDGKTLIIKESVIVVPLTDTTLSSAQDNREAVQQLEAQHQVERPIESFSLTLPSPRPKQLMKPKPPSVQKEIDQNKPEPYILTELAAPLEDISQSQEKDTKSLQGQSNGNSQSKQKSSKKNNWGNNDDSQQKVLASRNSSFAATNEQAQQSVQSTVNQVTNQLNKVNQIALIKAGGGQDDEDFKNGAWSSSFIGHTQDKRTASTINNNFIGGSIGYERFINDQMLVGIGFTRLSSVSSAQDGKVKIDANIASIYAFNKRNNFILTGAVFLGKGNIKITRSNNNGAINGKTDANLYGVYAGLGYEIRQKQHVIMPAISFTYSGADIDGYKESGASNDKISKSKSWALNAKAGVRYSYIIERENALIVPGLSVGVSKDVAIKKGKGSVRPSDGSQVFDIRDNSKAQVTFFVKPHLEWQTNNLDVNLSYMQEKSKKLNSHLTSIKLLLKF
jgi:hypothetical protein